MILWLQKVLMSGSGRLWTPLDPSPISNTDYLGHLNLGYVKCTHRRDEFLPLLHPF